MILLLLIIAAPFVLLFWLVAFLVRTVVPVGIVVGVILTPLGIIASWQVFPWPVAVMMTVGLIVIPFITAPDKENSNG